MATYVANYTPIIIDGGLLEGGGQILRIATSLSGILRRPIQVVNIRGNRPKPGLMAQHLTGLRVASEITGGQLSGDSIGSMEIRFKPGKAAGNGGQYFGDTGTAGSVTLLLQANLPILVFGTGHPCSLRLRGGTNVGMAPQVDYTTAVLRPLLERFGVHFNVEVSRRGYYPKGGGEVIATAMPRIEPMPPIELTERGEIVRIDGYCFVGNKSKTVAIEAAEEAQMLVKERYPSVVIDIATVVEERVGNNGAGNGIVLIATTSTGSKLAGSALGSRELPSSAQVGRKAAEELLRELETGAVVDSYAQDQLIIFMALASGRSRILTGPITLHTQTAIYVIEQMLPQVKFSITPVEGNPGLNLIECDGIAYSAKAALSH